MKDVKGSFATEKVGEIVDYGLKWHTELGEDIITSSSWSVPVGLTQPPAPLPSHDDNTTTIWLQADSAGEFECVNTILSAGGRRFIGVLRLKVSIPSPVEPPPPYTVGQLASLKANYAQGVLRVLYDQNGRKEVWFRSLDEMAQLISQIEGTITGKDTAASQRFSLGAHHRG